MIPDKEFGQSGVLSIPFIIDCQNFSLPGIHIDQTGDYYRLTGWLKDLDGRDKLIRVPIAQSGQAVLPFRYMTHSLADLPLPQPEASQREIIGVASTARERAEGMTMVVRDRMERLDRYSLLRFNLPEASVMSFVNWQQSYEAPMTQWTRFAKPGSDNLATRFDHTGSGVFALRNLDHTGETIRLTTYVQPYGVDHAEAVVIPRQFHSEKSEIDCAGNFDNFRQISW